MPADPDPLEELRPWLAHGAACNALNAAVDEATMHWERTGRVVDVWFSAPCDCGLDATLARLRGTEGLGEEVTAVVPLAQSLGIVPPGHTIPSYVELHDDVELLLAIIDRLLADGSLRPLTEGEQ